MKRIEKIYRDNPDSEEIVKMMIENFPCTIYNCEEDCRVCILNWLNEEVPEYDDEFVKNLKAVKLLFPWARYLAMDSSDEAYIYENYPDYYKGMRFWQNFQTGGRLCGLEAFKGYSTDWENSLIDKVIKEAEDND